MNPEKPWMYPTIDQRDGSFLDTSVQLVFVANKEVEAIIWAGIINDQIVGPVHVTEGVKLILVAYCNFLGSVFIEWFGDVSLFLRKKIVFMHDNAPSHSSKATTKFVASMGFKDH